MALEGFKLRHLQMLVALSEQGKVSLVAELFNLSPPALSRIFSELEYLAGRTLFLRHNRGTALTAEGEVLARHARHVLSEIQRAEYEMAVVAAGKRGSVALGTVMTPAADLVAPILSSLGDTNLDVNIFVGSSDALLADVLAHKLDFAICRISRGAERERFDYEPLGTENLKLVMSVENPLARLSVVDAADLAEVDWILQPKGSVIRDLIEDFHQKFGIMPRSIVSTSSVLLTLQLVRESGRVALLGASTAELFERYGMLRALSVGRELTLSGYGLVKQKGSPLTPAAAIVYRAFLEQYKSSTSLLP